MSTILVVDDEPGIREVIALLLDDEAYRVLEAEDGLSALELLAREQAHAAMASPDDRWIFNRE